MKNPTVKSYLLSINALGENTIEDIKIHSYSDEVACYTVKYFDMELAKYRNIKISIKLYDYHLFVKKMIRKQKLKTLSEVN